MDKDQLMIVIDKLRQEHISKVKYYKKGITPQLQMQVDKEVLIHSVNSKMESRENQTIGKRKYQQELDLFISLLLRNSPIVDDFVYVVQNPDSSDPYDLMLKDFQSLNPNKNRDQKKGSSKGKNSNLNKKPLQYYTVSIKGLTRFVDGNPVEFIELNDWIKERDTYDKIRGLNFFNNFLEWKTIKLWRQSYQGYKKQNAIKSLEEKLYFNYPQMTQAMGQV